MSLDSLRKFSDDDLPNQKTTKIAELNETKKEKTEKEKELLNSIEANIVYEKFLINITEIKKSNDPKERKDKITKIKDSFTKDGMIIYQDETWLVKQITDIEGFLNKVAKWEITIDFSIDIEKYVEEGAITLEKEKKDGIDNIRIKKVQLNADCLK